MKHLTLTIGETVAVFEIPPPAARPSAFAFSLHKAGSVMLDKIVGQMAKAAKIPAVNFPSDAFRQGLPESALPREVFAPVLMRDGYIFTGFRFLPGFLPAEALDGRGKVLLVRDPRDMLVSLYFSHRYSHVVPEYGPARDALLASRARTSATDIDTFVLSAAADEIAANYRAYIRAVGPDWRIYRYEDVIFRKRAWLADLSEFLDMRLGQWRLNKIADRNDLRPAEEDVTAHVRQVAPGNHKRALRAETVAALGARLKDILDFHAGLNSTLR